MARIQWKWRGSNDNGAGNKFRGASKYAEYNGSKRNLLNLIDVC
jgi:hypothetical protein